MPVTECKYAHGGRDCDFGLNESITHTDRFLILTDDVELHPYEVARQAQRKGPHKLPKVHDAHPVDRSSFVKSIKVSPVSNDPKTYHATVTYDNRVDNQPKALNPLDRPVIYQLEFQQFQRVVEVDIDGKPLMNTVGDMFDPPIVQDDSRPVLVATRNFKTLAEIVAIQQQYKDAVNLNTFYGAKAGQAKILSITAGEEKVDRGQRYYPVTFRIAFKGEGDNWQREILNRGMRYKVTYLDPGTEKKVSALRDTIGGTRITSPVLLNKDGSRYDRDAKDANGKVISPYFIKFRTYPERDFSGLRI